MQLSTHGLVQDGRNKMTREQALLDFTKGYCLVCEDNIPHFMEKQVARTINKVFDDFENDIKTAVANEHETLVMFYEDKLLECENDIKVITIDIKKQLAIAYMEGGSAMRDYFERIGEIK